ncbi:CCA tRNA nucleotidyltransferase [Bacillus sp. Marseille-Q3570]|uniref:CCA tRNA nucleotidyltransferase n=1 Tax=Bacillus sp. Marseille-Q3570 TaxID=2963522 RepID=UPI0021B7F397|nr:CCA tRNA nucleotidyltransferase [Bacillus sp. Marseille-Q3570]
MSFTLAHEIIEELEYHGFEAYIVGGIVRDRLLGRRTGDIDIATSALPEEVQSIFPKTIPVGIEHGTVIVRHGKQSFEVTTFRTEGRYEDFRRPTKVHFHQSIEADLSRRDFTINALALDRDGGIIDPFGAQDDIEHKLLKAVGLPADRFKEDPLRMMRGIRFVSVLGFEFEAETYSALVENAFLLEKISIERLRDEFEKMLFGEYCEHALDLLEKSKVNQHLPGGPFDLQINLSKYRWDKLKSIEERWAAFLIRNNVEDANEWLRVWKLPNQLKAKTVLIVSLIHDSVDCASMFTIYKYGLDIIKAVLRVKRFLGDQLEMEEENLETLHAQLPIKKRSELAIDGNDLQRFLKRKPGPWIAVYIEQIERGVIEGKIENTPSGIKECIQEWQPPQEKD